MKSPRVGSVWQGWKGGLYEVTSVGRFTEGDREYLVGYVDEKGETHYRPLSMWYDIMNRDGYKGPRFIETGVQNGSTQPIFATQAFKTRPADKRRGF